MRVEKAGGSLAILLVEERSCRFILSVYIFSYRLSFYMDGMVEISDLLSLPSNVFSSGSINDS